MRTTTIVKTIRAATLYVLNTDAFVVDPDGYGSEDNPWGLEEKLSNDKLHRLKVIAALVIAEMEVELDKQKTNQP